MHPRRAADHSGRRTSLGKLEAQLKVVQSHESTMRKEYRKTHSSTRHFNSDVAQESNLEMSNKALD